MTPGSGEGLEQGKAMVSTRSESWGKEVWFGDISSRTASKSSEMHGQKRDGDVVDIK